MKILNMLSFKKRPETLYRTPELRRKVRLSNETCLHISELSVVMLGICQSGVGLIHIAIAINKVDTYIDDLLALNSLVFLSSCFSAYSAFRSQDIRKTLQIGWVAEGFFVVGLFVMVIVSLLISYSSFTSN